MHLDQIEFLRALEKLPSRLNAPILRHCGDTGAHAIGECIYNFMLNTPQLRLSERRKLSKSLKAYQSDLQKLRSPKTSKEERRIALSQLSGKPISIILKKLKPCLDKLEKAKRKEVDITKNVTKKTKRRK